MRSRLAPDVNTLSSLHVKPMQDAPGIFEMTWDGYGGRATFTYSPEQIPGKP